MFFNCGHRERRGRERERERNKQFCMNVVATVLPYFLVKQAKFKCTIFFLCVKATFSSSFLKRLQV